MTDPYGMGRSLDAIMGAMSPEVQPAAPDTDYAAEAREALRVASGVDGDAAIAALDRAGRALGAMAGEYAVHGMRGEVDACHRAAATLRAMRAGLEGEKT